jgi:hypothetical protein
MPPSERAPRVNGELVGNVHASERVELTGKARVFGDLESPVVVLEEGVMFEGHCRMPRPGASASSGNPRRWSRAAVMSDRRGGASPWSWCTAAAAAWLRVGCRGGSCRRA